MASTPTTRNRLNKQGTGDNSGSWGTILNDQVLDLIDELADGITTVAVSGIVTLTATNYVTDQARRRILKTTGSGGTVRVPRVEKYYIIHNACASAITVTTGVGVSAVISAGMVSFFYCDGTNCYVGLYAGNSQFVSTVVGPVSNTAQSSFNAPPGSEPTSPVTGDIWITDSGGLRYYVDNLTRGIGVECILSGGVSNASVIDASFQGSYRSYELHITNLRVSNGELAGVRVSTNGGGIFRSEAADYRYTSHAVRSDGSDEVEGDNSSPIIVVARDLKTLGNRGAMVTIYIDRPDTSSFLKPIRSMSEYIDASERMISWRGAGMLSTTLSELTDIRFQMGSGTFSCNYELYGRR